MPPLRQHMLAALQLRGQRERTQQSSIREVRLLAQFYHTSPDRIAEQELQRSFLHRTNVDGLAPTSMRLCSSGSRFCSPHVLPRDWHTLTRLRAPTAHPLPAVLRGEEVRRLLAAATPFHNQVACTTVSRLGLRLHEALALQGSDIDGQRLQVPGHRGQGAKDRYVPLPTETLALLRTYGQTHRHKAWLFPATGRNHAHRPTATSPRRRPSVQGAFRTAKHRAELTKMGVAIHPLRPAYATHLLDAGVHPRLSQRSLGPPHLATTRLSLHRTHQGPEDADERLNALRHGLLPGPPCGLSAPPLPQSPGSALPTSPSRTARSSAPSHRATAARMAIASRSAPAVGDTTASTMPVATATVPSGSSINPPSGSSTTWTNNCPGRPSS